MGKIKINLSLSCNNEKIYDNNIFYGIKTSNYIVYKEDNTNVKLIIGRDSINLIKNKDDYELNMIFKNNSINQGTIKTEDGIIELNVKTINLCIDKKIEIMYYVEETENKYELSLYYEVIK